MVIIKLLNCYNKIKMKKSPLHIKKCMYKVRGCKYRYVVVVATAYST